MSDFVSFNEFVDRTASAKVEHYRETLTRALRRPAGETTGFLEARTAVVSDDTVEAEFAKMKDYVLGAYRDVADMEIQHTFLGPGGNFVDCIPFEQQATYRAARKAGHTVSAEPPAPTAEPSSAPDAPDAFGPLAHSILPPLRRGLVDPFGNSMTCADDRVPLRRVTISQMARLGTFDNFFRKYTDAAPFAGTLGSSEIHHHAVCNETTGGSYRGCSTWLNVWQTNPSPGVFSLSQLWLIGSTNAGKVQTIESGWQTFPNLWGTNSPALFVYYNPDGYSATNGGYLSNANHQGFIQQPSTNWIIGDAMPQPYSIMNGDQRGNQMQWQIDGQGNWWLYFGTGTQAPTALGHFPAGLYQNGTLAASAQTLQFGGEVCSVYPGTPTYPKTGPMGSGIPPSASASNDFGRVAFQKQMFVVGSGPNAFWANLQVLTDTRDAAYSATQVSNSGSAEWGSYMFFGGPNSN